MTYFQLKEANRYYWMVKGQLIPRNWKEEDIERTYKSYFNRLRANRKSAEYSTFGFEAAWAQRQAEKTRK